MQSFIKKKTPSILLIGAGCFGEKHLQKLLQLQKEGRLTLVGVVVSTPKTRKKISTLYGIPVWTELTDERFSGVDAVDIVTPPETHKEIVLRCLPHCDVFVEKPMAMNSKDARLLASSAKKYKRVLMVGHIFRFNPVTLKLNELLAPHRKEPVIVRGEFVNPLRNDKGRDIALELPHLFDIVDMVLGAPAVETVSTKNKNRIYNTEIRYRGGIQAIFRMGWDDKEKKRNIGFSFSSQEIFCDFLDNSIEVFDRKTGQRKRTDCGSSDMIAPDPLMRELTCFVDAVQGKTVSYPDGRSGIRLVETAEKANRQTPHTATGTRPKVAVIGGGIFGANCAIALGEFCDVELFEKNDDIMREASFVNQYRHHWGYHYPRSGDTVRDIARALADFERLYNDAIVRNFPTYYLIAKSGSKVSANDYLAFCIKHRLKFTKEYPAKEYVNREKISLSLKTLEPIYNYERLAALVRSYLEKAPGVSLRLGTEVVGGKIEKDGSKTLALRKGGKKDTGSFDYVINATYARHNAFLHWFNFPIKPVRIDLVEALIVRLPMPKISLAVMDGPFTNLVPTSDEGLFTLVHIRESIIERYVPKNGLPSKKKNRVSVAMRTLKKSAEWFPILAKAEITEKRYVFRAVNAYREYDDARPSDVSYHGFGMWSVLGGKIVNCVAVAKEISAQIKNRML